MGSIARVCLFVELTFKEVVRSRAYGFVILFSIISTASVHLFVNFTFQEQEKFLKDIGLASVVFFSLILGTVLGASQVHGDLESKTVYNIRANPVTSFQYLMGRFLGVALLVGFAMGLMGIVFYLGLVVQSLKVLIGPQVADFSVSRAIGDAIQGGLLSNLGLIKVFLAIYFQCLIVCSFSLLFSTVLSIPLAITGSVLVFILGHLIDLITQVTFQYNEVLGYILKLFFVWVPNFENFNIADAVVLGQRVSMGYMGWLGAYCLVSLGISLCVTHKCLSRRISDL